MFYPRFFGPRYSYRCGSGVHNLRGGVCGGVTKSDLSLMEHLSGQGKCVLDAGCGDGHLMKMLINSGYDVTGIDIDIKQLNSASYIGKVVCGDCNYLPFKNGSFDMVFLINVLHHVEAPSTLVEEISRVLKRRGTMYLSEVTESNPLLRLARISHPYWHSSEVKSHMRTEEVKAIIGKKFLQVTEDGDIGTIAWVWYVIGERIMSLDVLETAFLSKIVSIVDSILGKASNYRFSCQYNAVCKKR